MSTCSTLLRYVYFSMLLRNVYTWTILFYLTYNHNSDLKLTYFLSKQKCFCGVFIRIILSTGDNVFCGGCLPGSSHHKESIRRPTTTVI